VSGPKSNPLTQKRRSEMAESSSPKRSMARSIELPYGGSGARLFVDDLIQHIRESGRDYIIQGQTDCSVDKQPKPNSLDAWLGRTCTVRSDTKQAVNSLVDQLIQTRFEDREFVVDTSDLVFGDVGVKCARQCLNE
jgi:thiamine monophosphate synthase